MTEQKINEVKFADFDDEGTTVSVAVTSHGKTETFHIQTVDGEYRESLGCWIFTDDDGEDLDQDDYPDFDFIEIIREAEALAESNVEGEENPDYFNKDQSPYTRRLVQK